MTFTWFHWNWRGLEKSTYQGVRRAENGIWATPTPGTTVAWISEVASPTRGKGGHVGLPRPHAAPLALGVGQAPDSSKGFSWPDSMETFPSVEQRTASFNGLRLGRGLALLC